MNLLLTFLFTWSLTFAQKIENELPPKNVPAGAETFNCGVYKIAGTLRVTNIDKIYLELYPGTTRKFFINLTNVNLTDVEIYKGENVQANVQVTHEGKGDDAKFSSLEKLKHITRSDALHDPVSKLSSANCL